MKYTVGAFITALLFIGCSTDAPDDEELADIYYWKPSFVEIKEPTIIGNWTGGNMSYSFHSDGTGVQRIGRSVPINWKQRTDGKIYIEFIHRKYLQSNGEKAIIYKGFVKGGVFFHDTLNHLIKFHKD